MSDVGTQGFFYFFTLFLNISNGPCNAETSREYWKER